MTDEAERLARDVAAEAVMGVANRREIVLASHVIAHADRIASLEAENERLTQQRDLAREEMSQLHGEVATLVSRAETAERQLAEARRALEVLHDAVRDGEFLNAPMAQARAALAPAEKPGRDGEHNGLFCPHCGLDDHAIGCPRRAP